MFSSVMPSCCRSPVSRKVAAVLCTEECVLALLRMHQLPRGGQVSKTKTADEILKSLADYLTKLRPNKTLNEQD